MEETEVISEVVILEEPKEGIVAAVEATAATKEIKEVIKETKEAQTVETEEIKKTLSLWETLVKTPIKERLNKFSHSRI